MTALEYMERQLKKYQLNYERESKRGAPEETLNSIRLIIGYYEEAIAALRYIKISDEEFWEDVK